jgi:hydroxyacylglutathione hydrolase
LSGEGTGNNYAYLVTDDGSKESVIIDPAHPPEYYPQNLTISNWLTRSLDRVLPVLKEKTDSGAIKLTNIINTHQ